MNPTKYLLVVALLLPQPAQAQNEIPLKAKTSTLQPVLSIVGEKQFVIQETVERTTAPQPDRRLDSQSNKGILPTPTSNGGLLGTIGYANPFGNCILEAGLNKGIGNPINWSVLSTQPRIGSTALFRYNHVGVVTGIWGNGDLEIRHQNYKGGQTRFSRSTFRGFR